MRILAIALLTICQFTAVPFLAIVASNTAKQEQLAIQVSGANVTTIYKTISM